jgi:hypothetical protein
MPQSLSKILVHLIFSTKHRERLKSSPQELKSSPKGFDSSAQGDALGTRSPNHHQP